MATVRAKSPERATHTIDAADQAMGRVAVRVSTLLQGKHKAAFLRYLDGGDFVVVQNIRKMKFSGRKLKQKQYYRHSGYPKGLKARSLGERSEKNPAELFRHVVWGMLPKNKLRNDQIKRLRVEA